MSACHGGVAGQRSAPRRCHLVSIRRLEPVLLEVFELTGKLAAFAHEFLRTPGVIGIERRIGERRIDGRVAVGFEVPAKDFLDPPAREEPEGRLRVWVRGDTATPVLVEVEQGLTNRNLPKWAQTYSLQEEELPMEL